MEASQVQDGAVEDQGSEQDQEQKNDGQGPDLQPIFERLEQMGQDFRSELDERFQAFEQPLQQQEPEPDPVDQDLQRMYESDEDVDPAQARQVLDRMVEAKANELLAPLAQEIEALRTERAGEQLMEKYPEFKDTKKAEQAWNQAFDLAMEMTRGNEQLAEWLANQPQMIETAHLAGVARQRAADDGQSGGEREVELESAGAAVPGQADPDDALRKSIREAGGERNSFLTG